MTWSDIAIQLLACFFCYKCGVMAANIRLLKKLDGLNRSLFGSGDDNDLSDYGDGIVDQEKRMYYRVGAGKAILYLEKWAGVKHRD